MKEIDEDQRSYTAKLERFYRPSPWLRCSPRSCLVRYGRDLGEGSQQRGSIERVHGL